MSTAFLPLNFYADRIASGVDGLIVDESKYVIVEKDSNACVNGGNELSSDEKANLMESSTRNICRWLPQNEESIRGICVIAHGMLEHAQNYHEFACKLAIENKFAVYAMDHVGHGESSGDSGFFDSYELLVDEYIDLHYWIRSTQHNNNNLPCFLFGHSLGSMIVSAACNRIPNVKAVGLSALPLDAGPGAASLFGIRALYPLSQTSVAIPILKFLSSIDPRGNGAPVFLESCTSDPEKLEFAKSDFRRVHTEIMNKPGLELLKLQQHVREECLSKITLPIYLGHGAEDDIAFVSASKMAYSKIATASENKNLKIFEKCRHELFKEKEETSTVAMQSYADFFNERLEINNYPEAIEAQSTYDSSDSSDHKFLSDYSSKRFIPLSQFL